MKASADDIIRELQSQGFSLTCRTSAIALLAHPELAGLEVRIGTRFVVVQQRGRELYRSSHAEFDLERVLALARAPD